MQKQRMQLFWPLLGCSLFAFSCDNMAEPDRISKTTAGTTYADYKVWAEEGQDEVTVRLQYHRGDIEGPAFALPPPAKVLLDGEELVADSTRFNGVFYELSKPVGAFRGHHTITVVGADGKSQKETFEFTPFTLASELPANLKKKPFSIFLNGLPDDGSLVRVVIIDTDYESADVNEEIVPENGVVEVTEQHLSNLTKGPIVLEIYQEVERNISGNGHQTGRFSLTYGLRRQLSLVE
jgi:hypothetical protein